MTPAASAAAMTARTPSARSSGEASAVAGANAAGDRPRSAWARAGRPSPRAPRRPGRSPAALAASRRSPSSSVRPDEATPTRLPTTKRRFTVTFRLGHVLVDLAVREAGQRGVLGHDQRLALGRALALGVGEHALGERQGVAGPVVVHRRARRPHHLPTPTWTSRNRAPGTAWPTCPVWPGSPLPQFGVPSIT